MNYYNEFDPFAAAWLKNLIAAGLIPAGVVHPNHSGCEQHGRPVAVGAEQLAAERAGGAGGWGDTWIPCADGKARRLESGVSPLVDGFPGRVGLVRGYGNAIVPRVAAEFIAAYMECRP